MLGGVRLCVRLGGQNGCSQPQKPSPDRLPAFCPCGADSLPPSQAICRPASRADAAAGQRGASSLAAAQEEGGSGAGGGIPPNSWRSLPGGAMAAARAAAAAGSPRQQVVAPLPEPQPLVPADARYDEDGFLLDEGEGDAEAEASLEVSNGD